MKIGVNLTEEEAKAFKARKEQELGPGWCVDVYQWQGRWLARASSGRAARLLAAPAVPPASKRQPA